jgi:hypothetical protein
MRKPDKRSQVKRQGVHGEIILKWILQEQMGEGRVYSSASGYGPVESSYEHGSKMLKNNHLLKRNWCIEFVSQSVTASVTHLVNWENKQFFIFNSATNAPEKGFCV